MIFFTPVKTGFMFAVIKVMIFGVRYVVGALSWWGFKMFRLAARRQNATYRSTVELIDKVRTWVNARTVEEEKISSAVAICRS